jgi:hypothetical protein
METAQMIDETNSDQVAASASEGLSTFGRYKGVQFAVAVESGDAKKFDQWGSENPDEIATFIHATSANLRKLSETLEAGQLEEIEAMGPQRHLAVLVGDEESLGIGFTRSVALPHIRETMKQVEAKWVS